MKIAILGLDLAHLVCSHTILDQNLDTEIHLISEKAEAGLIGELPGLIKEPFSETIPSNLSFNSTPQPAEFTTTVSKSENDFIVLSSSFLILAPSCFSSVNLELNRIVIRYSNARPFPVIPTLVNVDAGNSPRKTSNAFAYVAAR